ncbi:unnamed protein product [Miscanthus lutarioriparius]|uniref:Uncharacterized protein n=1 Tax=Miscanthus lutarioriparius TaxID=422564 RepID=A0A811R7V1_9POAL|nr:unnamed protein product [Miscanthus lutarioriparius]
MAARFLLFQLPRFVLSRLGALYHRASPSAGPGLQRILVADTSHKQVAVHSDGDAIVATSLPRVADAAAELLAVKRRAPSPKAGAQASPRKTPAEISITACRTKKPRKATKPLLLQVEA